MKSIFIVLTTVAVVAMASALAIMNNACKSGQQLGVLRLRSFGTT